MTKVKICGIQDSDTAKIVAASGADIMGIVLAPSKRQISIKAAKDLASVVRGQIQIAGVFVNADFDFIRQAVEDIPLDYIQLHGDEPADFAQQVKDFLQVKVIKAFPQNTALTYREIFTYPADLLLIDSPRQKFYGGNGLRFDWTALENHPDINYSKFILAGGINQENVQEAIQTAHPMMVDLSSSLEINGHKDHNKIRAFMQTIKGVNKNDR